MRSNTKLILTGLLAAIAMTLAVSSASASRLSISNRNIRVVWASLDFEESGGGVLLECPVTLEGSFHSSTVRKTNGALIAFVSRASVRGAEAAGACTGGSATILTASLPWHVTYDSFTGTLPRPTGVVLLLARTNYQVVVFGVTCLYGEGGGERARGTAEIEPNGLVTGVTPDPNIGLPKISGSFFCPGEAGFGNIGRVTVLGSTTNIAVRLI